MNKFNILLMSAMALVVIATVGIVFAAPNGASTVTEVSDSSAAADPAGNNSALAGNVTELTISGSSTTQSWQGYFGNVSGVIELANAAGNVLYNWSVASPQGEVYASNDSSVTWSNIVCFNQSILGGNLTALETSFGIALTDSDGVNETFSDANDHDAFSTAGTSFNANDCPATFVYDSTGQGVNNNFEEVLLTDQSYTGHAVYAALLEEDLAGFDSALHDFEMLVLEDGHLADTATTTYYFYVELE